MSATIVTVAALVGAIVALLIVWSAWRWRHLYRAVGAFECHLRLRGAKKTGWRRGVARYDRDALDWYSGLGFRMRPKHRLNRQTVEAGSLRWPDEAEKSLLFDGQQIVPLDDRRRGVTVAELALSAPGMTAFTSWMEAAAPGMGRYGRTGGETAV